MKLQGRNLSIDMQGDDVRLLHTELRQLGFVIPDDELRKSFFGEGTRDAVWKLQDSNRLRATGEVDEIVAKLMTALVDLSQPELSPRVDGDNRSSEKGLQPIVAPINPGESGPPVANLQDAIFVLLKNGKIRDALDDPTQEELGRLTEGLKGERPRSQYGASTQQLIKHFQQQHNVSDNLRGVVSDMTADKLNEWLTKLVAFDQAPQTTFVVRGRVTGASEGQLVRAFNMDLSGPPGEELGRAFTDAEGNYEIRYSAEKFGRAAKGAANLRIAVYRADESEQLSSDIFYNAAPDQIINLEITEGVPPPPSEYERYLIELRPVLRDLTLIDIDRRTPELKEKDLDFLAGDTGIDRQHIAWLVQAAGCEEKSKSVDPTIRTHVVNLFIPAAVFYGSFREGVPDQWEQLIEQSIGTLRSAARAAIAHAIIPAELEASIETSLDAMPNPRRDELRDTAAVTGLAPDVLGTVLRNASSVADVNNLLVSRLVEEGAIPISDAHRLGLGLAVHGLVNGNEATIAALVNAKPARWGDRGLQRARDLAALDASDIKKALEDAKLDPPDGMTLPNYAAQLAVQAAEAFPTDALLYRATHVSSDLVSAIERVATTPDAATSDPQVRAFVNLHPGLALGKLLNDAGDAASAVSGLKKRVAWFDRAHELNPDLDLLAIDYLPESESLPSVKFDGLSDEARSMVIANFKAYQRMQATGAGALGSIELLKAGYSSATALARSLPDEIAEKSGLPVAQVRAYHAQAEREATNAALSWFAFHDLERDSLTLNHKALLGSPAYLKKLKGYADLFGSLDFCHCEQCQSVLGAGAYFVDLMFFVERFILNPSFKNVGGDQNALHLRSRRSDLWTELEITCDNTNKVVPSLDLVINLLEKYIVKEKQLTSVAQLYERLSGVDHSIRLPFSLPLERLSILLSHLGLSRSDIARTLLLRDEDAAVRARVRLGMLPKQFEIITTSRLNGFSAATIGAAELFFIQWLGLSIQLSRISVDAETASITTQFSGGRIRADVFAHASGLDRSAVRAILSSDFVNGATTGAPARIFVEAGIGTPGGVQNDMELVGNLTPARLDRFERFVRLWRHVPWTATELSYVIGRLQKQLATTTTAENRLDESIIVALVELLDLQDRFQLPVDELCSLWDRPPLIALRGDLSLFERVFNLPPFVRQDRAWPNLNQQIDGSVNVRARLVAALQLDDQSLAQLAAGLNACLDRVGTAAPLNERNLSLLYRHARIARLLKLSITELFQTIAWTRGIAARSPNQLCIRSLADVQAVLETHGWRAASGFSIQEALFLTKAKTTLAEYESADVLATRIAGEVVAERLLHISADLFTQIGLTHDESRKVIEANSTGTAPVIERIAGEDDYRIVRGIGVEVVATLAFDEEPGATLIGEIARELYRIVKLAGSAGFKPADLQQIGLSEAEAIALVNGKFSSVAAYRKPFESVSSGITDPTPRYRLRASVSEASAIASFGLSPADVAREGYRIVTLAGAAGFETTKLQQLGLTAAEAVGLVNANVSSIANDGKPFESVPGGAVGTAPRYRIRAAVSEAGTIARLSSTLSNLGSNSVDVAAAKSVLKRRAQDLLLRHHAETVLATKASVAARVSPEKAKALLNLVKPTTLPARESLVDSLQGGPIHDLVTVLDRMTRYSVLFRAPVFDPKALEFVRVNPAALALDAPLTVETLRRVSNYSALATAPDPAYQSDAAETDVQSLRAVLNWGGSISQATSEAQFVALAKALKSDAAEVKAALAQMTMPGGASAAARVNELVQLKRALDVVRSLAVPAEILKHAVSEAHVELTSAADGIFAAIRAKYPAEKAFHDKLEPFEDKLRSRNRDGLVEYLLTAPDDATTDWRTRFGKANDLYQHFLTDVMVEGCARTSRVVAAISSVQLYVHRVLMNLEQSDDAKVSARLDADVQQQWKWRKNYQVWVANRKVFLYPENYIEPGLRDDKTPLFKEFEDTLLQQQITEQNVLDAYAKYLHGFEEVGRLRIAGAYHDRTVSGRDLLHLFGVTASDPPVYYYRTIRNLENSAGPVFSAWEKLDLQIPVRKVSPIVYLGRLYVFWVETTTRPLNEFKNGSSEFTGYRHSVRTKFSQLRLDGRWTPPQTLKVPDDGGATADVRLVDDRLLSVIPAAGENISEKPADSAPKGYKRVRWDIRNRDHTNPIETYTPEGWQWERTYPEIVTDSLGMSALVTVFVPRSDSTTPVEQEAIDFWALTLTPLSGQSGMTDYLADTYWSVTHGFVPFGLGGLPSRTIAQVLNGAQYSSLLESDGQGLLAQYLPSTYGARLLRLTTSISTQLGDQVVTGGIDGMLNLISQFKLVETASPFPVNPNSVDTTGLSTSPYGPPNNSFSMYFREVFLHIPFLIADHLNSQQKFADAQQWYHYLYDPTANEPKADEKTRPWRYLEFRRVKIEELRETLTNKDALAAYRRDPFNPHAIARLRPGAYQKSIIMKYIDNLLDWGDSLFSRFTMESVNEATMLYVMAADILGPRPTELGPCGETSATPKTYAAISPLLSDDKTDFLIEELEAFTREPTGSLQAQQYIVDKMPQRVARSQAATAAGAPGVPTDVGGSVGFDGPADPAGWNRVGAPTWKEKSGTPLADLYSGGSLGGPVVAGIGGSAAPEVRISGDPVEPPVTNPPGGIGQEPGKKPGPLGAPKGFDRDSYVLDVKYGPGDIPLKQRPPDRAPPQPKPFELAHSRLVFCFPENKELRGYWDRVEDRLNKIRNCMDIAGVRRRLELFAPEIDPRMLVRMRAAGLSLDDVMNVTSGNLPPYRFAYLIEKAKQHAGVVQNFGSQVLSALEKRDAEELTRLRAVHEQNLLKLRSQMTQWEIEAAEDTLESLRRQQIAAEYRRDHFATLAQTGLSGFERVQQVSTHIASGLHDVEATVHILAAVLSMLPQLGAPTAIVYGGIQLGGSGAAMAHVNQALAQASAAAAASAGLEATFHRRDEDWKHQVELAKKDLAQIDKQIAAAEIRRDIASESLKIHERSVEQVQEIFDFLRDRFTNFGRFTWLSAELQKLHRTAFNAALSMARLAEQACHFEHPDEAVKPALTGDYWDAGNAGLLAGDRLLLDLHNLERRYIETNHRTLEIEQSFSLARFNPDALSKLRTECACTFEIPEWFFDLTYPGHYRRRIKAVRLTIPCVVGPHANIGATLRLTESHIRKDPRLDSSVAMPLRHTSAIAASMGQSDAGVFEFSFRDERYMPFEGAGVNSQWQLSLPKRVKPFDYGTISDVILRISYTAEEDSGLRQAAEAAMGVLSKLTDQGVTQTLSLRGDFPDAWHMLLGGASEVTIEVRDIHLPFFMSAFELEQAPFDLLVNKLSPPATYPRVDFDGNPTTGSGPNDFSGADTASGLWRLGRSAANALGVVAKHVIKITDLGSASVGGTGGSRRLDDSKIRDIVLRVSLKRRPPPTH